MPDLLDPADLRWFHVVFTTYGAWLPGDPRGFRTRRHRDHVAGDYMSPPEAGIYEGLHRAAKRQLTQDIVTFSPARRNVIVAAIADKVVALRSLFAIVAVAGRHAHLLLKLPPRLTQHWCGQIKRHVTFTLKESGWTGKVWGKGEKIVPVESRSHQLSAYGYIQRHAEEGAAVLTWKEYEARRGVGQGPGDAIAGLWTH